VKIIDTHCHYNLEPLYSGNPVHFRLEEKSHLLRMNWQDHWEQAQQHEIAGTVVVGANKETSLLAIEIAELKEQIIAAIGIHPEHALDFSLVEIENFFNDLLPNGNVKAIGETGLDYFRLERGTDLFAKTQIAQQELFKLQISLAQKHNLPLIIHVRDDQDREDAYWQTLEILKQKLKPTDKFVLHCVSGPSEYVTEAVQLGGYIGFDGNVSYKKADSLRNLIKQVPMNRLLIETDAPYLPPQMHRGKVCEPWMIAETAKFAEEELQLDLEQIYNNSEEFFNYSFSK